jgi:protein TonB
LNPLLKYRDGVSVMGTAVLFLALANLPSIQLARPRQLPPPTMQVTLAMAPPPAPVPVVPPPPPAPAPKIADAASHPLPPPPKPVKKPPPPRPHPVVHHMVVPPQPQAQPAPVTPPMPPAPPAPVQAPVDQSGALNASYNQLVVAEVQAQKHYPTGREALTEHPTGTAVVSFTLDRSGNLIDAEIETASGSMILDRAALETVRRGVYPPFPDGSYPGQSQQSFTVSLDYVQPTS